MGCEGRLQKVQSHESAEEKCRRHSGCPLQGSPVRRLVEIIEGFSDAILLRSLVAEVSWLGISVKLRTSQRDVPHSAFSNHRDKMS